MSRNILFVFFLVLFFGAALVSAQDIELTETQLFESGAGFSFPDGWTVEENEGTYITIVSDLTSVTLLDYPFFDAMGLAPDADLALALETYFVEAHDGDFDDKALSEIEVGAHAGARFDYEDASGNSGLLLVLPFTDGGFGMIDAVSLDGDMQEEDAVLAIAESFDSAATSGGSCTVSTDQERTVRVHVGPGENRTSYTFMPANQTFEVQGQATADDDSLWWKLDREAVAPDAAANEAWIAQDDVEAEGDCAAVVDVNAPPIIPIVSEPPPPPPDAGSGEEGGTTTTTTEGSITPTPGAWTLSSPANVPASCLGTETTYIPLNMPPLPASVSGGGSSIVFDGDRLALRQPNVYGGLFNLNILGGPISAEIVLRVQSPTRMTGEFIYTEVFEGTACSITVPITVTKN